MKTAPFAFLLKTALAAVVLGVPGEPADHVVPENVWLAQTIVTPAARWTRALNVSGAFELHSSPGGNAFAVAGGGETQIMRSRDGTRLARIPAIGSDSFVVGDAVTIRSRGTTMDAFANAGGRALWHRTAGAGAAIDDESVFVSSPSRLTAYDLLTGRQRWQQESCGKVGIDSVLPNGVLVTSVYCGEPHQDIVTLLDAKTGRETYVRGGESIFKTEIDGIAILQDGAAGNITQPDGYAPADVVLVAAAGGRAYSDVIYRPDPAKQSTAFEDRAASDVFVTRSGVFVKLDSTYYRYDRNESPPGAPVAFTSTGKALVVGTGLVMIDGSGAYRVDGSSEEVALTQISGPHLSGVMPRAPYLLYRDGGVWHAVDVSEPSTVWALGPLCTDSQVVNVDRGFVTACSRNGHVILSNWPTPQTPSSDGILRSPDEQTALAAPTPIPTPQSYYEHPLTLHVPVSRAAGDLSDRLLSPAVRSMTARTDGEPYPKVIDLTAANPKCRAEGDGMTCDTGIPLVYGAHTLTLELFDRPGGGGNMLAHSHTHYLSNGIPANAVIIDLHGIAASISIGSDTTELKAGKAQNVALRVVAKDADGYPILNGAEYDLPILVTMTATGSSKLSRATITAARQPVLLHYDGTAAKEIVVTAIVPGAASAKLFLSIRR